MTREDAARLPERNVEVLRQVLDGFNRHDLDAIMSHFAEDCVFEAPRGPESWGRRFAGKDEVRRGLAARFQGIPDVRYGDDDHFACGPRGVSEWTLRGTTVDGSASRCAVAICGPSGPAARSSARTASGRSASANLSRHYRSSAGTPANPAARGSTPKGIPGAPPCRHSCSQERAGTP
jgi:taurine dehydrogenase small subunit